ncbi:MAG: Rrf2 family nitric oxide-sensitive transcriptional repressor [Chlamydiales bacterium]|jgi:Rrf2 family nitric oxide-sensitive transcriptional repressor
MEYTFLYKRVAIMLSQTARYALLAIVCLGTEKDRPMTVQRIAERTNAPTGYLSKVMQLLTKAGLVRSQRGLNGGFTLIHSPDDISLFDIVHAIDPIQFSKTCPLKVEKTCASKGVDCSFLCPLLNRLNQINQTVEDSCRATNIGELVSYSNEVKAPCSS